MRRTTLVFLPFAAAISLSMACKEEVTGPQPAVENPVVGEPLPVDPGIVCNEQHPEEGTPIVLTGAGFSPIPYGLPDNPETALPTLRLTRALELGGDAGDSAQVVYGGGDTELANMDLLSWQSDSQMTFQLTNELTIGADGTMGALGEGVYDLNVTNANTNDATSVGTLAVVSRPFSDAVAPGIACLAEGERTLTITGQRVLSINGDDATVTIDDAADFGEATVAFDATVESLEDCTAVAHEGIDARYCNTVNITVGENVDDIGFFGVRLHNPETAACSSRHEADDVNLRVVPPPSIESVQPPMVCVAEGPRDVVLVGQDFLEIDGTLPAVTVDGASVTVKSVGGCEDLQTQGHAVQRCTEVTIEVPEAMTTGVEVPTVELTNPDPAGCSGSTSTALVIVPPPTITDIAPPLVCLDDADQTVEVIGSGFIFVDGVAPAVEFEATSIAPSGVTMGSRCEAVPVVGLGDVQRCDTIMVTIPQMGLTNGRPDITVTNPDPAGCSATASDLLTIVDGPQITAATPALVCTDDGDRQVDISGTGFLDVGGSLPSVTFDGNPVMVDSVSGCTPVTVNGLTVNECDTITVFAAQGSLAPGDTIVQVTNPIPADCTVSNDFVLTVPPTLAITSANPATVCQAGAGVLDVVIVGDGFLRVDGTDFTVTVDGTPVTPNAISGCTALTVDGMTVESCTNFFVTVDASTYPVGPVPIEVTNPAPSGCVETAATIFEITAPPTVSSVMPNNICAETAETLTITGSNFAQNVVVSLGMNPADMVVVDPSGTSLTATWTMGVGAGVYDLTVSNGGGCEVTLPNEITVDPLPLVFFVDPPVIYNGVDLEATVFTANLMADAQTVELIDAMGNRTPIMDFSSPVRPNRILATFPAGLMPGTYEVSVTSPIGCESSLNGTVTITDMLTLAVASVDPSFASPTVPTAIRINAEDPAPAGQVQFESTPRVYLNPNPAVAGTTATALRAVVFEDPTTLSAVVPGGLTPGQYDLVVVNPSGAVGTLSQAVTVTAVEPPFVGSVAPASLDASTGVGATVTGANFDTAGVTIELECSDFVTGNSLGTFVASPSNVTTTSADFTVDGGAIGSGAVCVVIVTNPDGSFYRFSALSTKNPAQNLNPWTVTGNMQEARRAPQIQAGRPTDQSRFLYAVGGDDGALANAKTSVESAPADPFGGLGVWTYQRNDLSNAYDAGPASLPRTFGASARIGRFLYLTGGNDGAGPTSTVLRAEILDPLAGPEIVDVDADIGDGVVGLSEGLYLYRVAAVFPETDPSNPGGESLPGEVLNVDLPFVADNIVLTLNWEQIPGASGYRIYRTPGPDMTVSDVEMLVEIVGGANTTFVDDDGLTTDPATTPMPQGSTGVWHTVEALGTARYNHASAFVIDSADPNTVYLYAAGGNDGLSALASVEYTTITIASDGSQTVTPWQATTTTLATAREGLSALVVTSDDTNALAPGESYIYFTSGVSGGTARREVDFAPIDANGDLSGLALSGQQVSPVRAGAAGLSANGFLFLLGGQNGAPSSGGISTEILANGIVDNWNSLGGGGISANRAFTGAAKESAFFFVGGGASNGAGTNAVTTIYQTVQ